MDLHRVVAFVRAALECSIYLAPTEPGLTHAELVEIGRRLGYQVGELNDALAQVNTHEHHGPRNHLMPDHAALVVAMWFNETQHPEYRNRDAADFVFSQMDEAARLAGRDRAALERSVLVERAVQSGLPRLDCEAAITLLHLYGIFRCEGGILTFPPGRSRHASPSEQRRDSRRGEVRQRPELAKVYPVVKDVVARRADGRPPSSEPFEAFAAEMQALGYGAFRMWWTQAVAELRQCDAQTAPLAATVLAAALVEGALTFVVKHAVALGLGTMGSKDFEKPPQTWRIDDLIASAARGGPDAILDNAARQRAETLIRTRQRIHAGRMLADFPGGPPDLRPEEARDAKATAELVVRRILDWLQRFPPGAARGS